MSVPQKPLRAILWIAVSSTEQAKDEKDSLPAQERDLRALADREDWTVIDVMIVTGFSRRYYTIREFADDALLQNIDAGQKLLQHLEDEDFDVFACRDGSRFGRTQAIFSEVVERIIDSGARIFSLKDGWITETNFRMFNSMAGYSAAAHVDWLVQARKMGISKRLQNGLPPNTLPMSHKLLRDEKGKPLHVVINEANRSRVELAMDSLLNGMAWVELPIELARNGYVNPQGRHYSAMTFRNLFYNAWFWGHSAVISHSHTYETRRGWGIWGFDTSASVPEGIEIYRNTHEPFFCDRGKGYAVTGRIAPPCRVYQGQGAPNREQAVYRLDDLR